ncbi:MAG: hypothetical protein MUP55_02800, partial [Candidatus Aenigmarchaeota archaeon]|nr:hypothetical protein [Candidatus Aenigmarchaeota archaeon]
MNVGVEIVDDKVMGDSSTFNLKHGDKILIKAHIMNPRTIPTKYRAELYLINQEGKKVHIETKSGMLGRRPMVLQGMISFGGLRAFGSNECEVMFTPVDTEKYEPGTYKFKVEVFNDVLPLGVNVGISPQKMRDISYNVSIEPKYE